MNGEKNLGEYLKYYVGAFCLLDNRKVIRIQGVNNYVEILGVSCDKYHFPVQISDITYRVLEEEVWGAAWPTLRDSDLISKKRNQFERVKLLLRRLEDMTEEEGKEAGLIGEHVGKHIQNGLILLLMGFAPICTIILYQKDSMFLV
ncbi:MAG TPA: hypothetical protein VK543_04685 [Puia sp.]|nr:hypothetical protein [Puia sp.]